MPKTHSKFFKLEHAHEISKVAFEKKEVVTRGTEFIFFL